MKVLQINTIAGTGSTGRITEDILEMLLSHGKDGCIAVSIDNSSENYANKVYQIGQKTYSRYFHALAARFTDRCGFFSSTATQELITYVQEEKFDIIHLHNLHGYYINLPILINELNRMSVKIVWTFHDCWPITGHCTYFDYVGCMKWKTQCNQCQQKSKYPKSIIIDRSKKNYLDKKRLFNKLDCVIVTPSKWLKTVCKQSFLAKKTIEVIPNGVDLKTFYPRETSHLRERYGLENKFVVMAVSARWMMYDPDDRKGLKDIIKLSKILDDTYQIVIVGFLNDKAMKGLPKNIMGVKRTNSLEELAEWYSLGDVFINPTKEEVLGMVNIESLACGTPVLTYDSGGSPETITNETGMVIKKGDIRELAKAIKKCKHNNFTRDDCIQRAQNYEKLACYERYYDLYQRILNS
ncbi:glycosyltransferase [Lachnospiraceae bacterium 56-18]|jgi:glycosyltransferase involved in cell wall biosynthesis|uniref:glycosyltransferase n=1 Tax=Sporofaciens sp. JLR.KK001 TaxID=3112621 RepID=UPI002FEE705E